MRRIVNSINLIFDIPRKIFNLLKLVKINGFIGGLIFGAIFSLVVNILTVKIQEIVNRQRVLEALEREITYHLLDINSIYSDYNKYKNSNNNEQIAADIILGKRLSTRIWDNTEAAKYLLELEPNTAAKVEMYYEAYIKPVNKLLDKNYAQYSELFKPCEPFYTFITEKVSYSISDCNLISINSMRMQTIIVDSVDKNLDDVKKDFHPTRDRLESQLLRLLMGNKSVEILK